jgi:hypothetical protein
VGGSGEDICASIIPVRFAAVHFANPEDSRSRWISRWPAVDSGASASEIQDRQTCSASEACWQQERWICAGLNQKKKEMGLRKFLFVIALAAMYVATAEVNANRRAGEYCDSVKVGEPADGLRGRALEAGARPKDSGWVEPANGPRELLISFTGFMPGSDYVCLITERNSAVAEKKLLARSLFARKD